MATRNSVNSIIGNLSKFKPENDCNNYIEQMEFFFLANFIEADNKKKALLLSSCGSDTYKLFESLVAPGDIGRSSYTEIKCLMGEHKNPKPNQIAKQFKFKVETVKVTNRYQSTLPKYVVSPNFVITEQWSNSLVVKLLDSKSRGPVFKTAGWLQGRLSLSSL